jgi:glycosyltransferase involved in cell wall biosynthesis
MTASPRTLVVTSTFPQWETDPRGAFLRRFWEARARQGERVEVLAPRTAWCRGELDTPLHVRRFAYAPAVCSTLSGEHGILENLRARPWRALLVPAFFAGMAAAVARSLAAGPCDRVVAHMLIPSGLVVAALCRRASVPFELYGHGTDVDVLLAAPGVLRRAIERCFAAAAAIHVPSLDKRRRLVGALPALAGRCHVATMAHTVPAAPVERRPVSGRVLFLGRLIRQKGVAELVDAIAQLGPGASLVVAGDGPERARLVTRAARAGIDATFVGFVEGERKRELFATAAVVCVPSREVGCLSEGAPLVLLEARAERVPVVATRVGGIPELAAGDEGITLVEPADARALAEALRQRLHNAGARPRALAMPLAG